MDKRIREPSAGSIDGRVLESGVSKLFDHLRGILCHWTWAIPLVLVLILMGHPSKFSFFLYHVHQEAVIPESVF